MLLDQGLRLKLSRIPPRDVPPLGEINETKCVTTHSSTFTNEEIITKTFGTPGIFNCIMKLSSSFSSCDIKREWEVRDYGGTGMKLCKQKRTFDK